MGLNVFSCTGMRMLFEHTTARMLFEHTTAGVLFEHRNAHATPAQKIRAQNCACYSSTELQPWYLGGSITQ